MTIDMPSPISLTTPDAPDADWLTVRDRVASQLTGTATPKWTDYNAPDPGVTLLEAAAFSIADLHYRVADAGFSEWPLAWPGWLAPEERPWQGALPEPSEEAPALSPLADAVKALLDVASADVEREVAAAPSRRDAETLLATAPFASAAPGALRAPAVSVLRTRLLRRVALEHADVIADAIAQADAKVGTGAQRDAAAALEVEARTGLWPDECARLVVRERRRAMREVAQPLEGAVPPPTAGAFATAGLTADEARVAAAAPRVPVDVTPELLEGGDGATQVWPPHAIQALTCEPVVANDYARRARTHPAVDRAWAVKGRLKGIAWNGLPTRDPAFVPAPTSLEAAFGLSWVVDPDAAALTIIVDAPAVNATDGVALRAILAHAVGTETYTPAPTWRDSLDPLDPRRLVCDEVGLALLAHIQVIVQATLIIPATASPDAIVAAASAAVQSFFDAGRPEATTASIDDPLSGPWEPAPQPAGGWIPGDPVRFSEVVEHLMSVPEVIAVTSMSMMTVEDTHWTLPSEGALALPAGTVPDLAVPGCFTTSFQIADAPTTGGCNA